SFTGSSTTGGIDQWNWEFGDGQYGRGQTQSHAYTTAGTKKVILTVTKGGVTSDPVEQSVTVKLPNPLDADFSFYPENPKTDQNVTFTDKSAGSPDEWEWIFGDNKFAYVKNPSHKYAKDGKYDVKLIITKAGGYSATITKTITVGTVTPTPTIGPEPKAEFKWEPSTPMVGTPVSFTDTSTGGGITEWKWDFDDKMDFTGNRESKLQNPQHTYQYPGVYDVTLFVKNSGGTDIILKKVTVITVPLNARFTASPASGTAPLSVRFVDSSTGTGIKSYQWDFGNGQTYTGKSPSNVVYSSPGTYRVSLEIADENGYKNMYAMNIIANPPATATPPQTTALMATSAPDVEDGGFIGGEYRMMTGLYNEYIRIIFGFLGIADGLDFLMFAVE
ncbi:MAG: PKD domain-containing protein, partial [Methanomicrobiales archaeon]|nr:PKD domain-containing protein [Methanomicrobiales archaeon]